MEEQTPLSRLKAILSKLNVEVYSNIDGDDLLVAFGRLKPLNNQDTNMKASESRLIFFIESALKIEANSKADPERATPWTLRFSRPWVLKNDKVAFTWDFTIKGDLNEALTKLEGILIAPSPDRGGDAPMNTFVKPARGTIKQVRIGSLR
jgi:hypothetical protein